MLAHFVTTHAAAILAASGGTLSYDVAEDRLILTGPLDGAPITLTDFSAQVYTGSISGGSSEVVTGQLV